ncbi:uncharacterized protein HGUI_02132 [Hanseniaspora guilliermondii]|uniref:Uncharacterized protein n=1 Tax=Hanseniaspora guilliermondii TaxID=56406 RepID=A0A1L0B289_9ASCO|nr:uncharacterized protein HGUI_02132 [Hanseniaspora guilliermondii]
MEQKATSSNIKNKDDSTQEANLLTKQEISEDIQNAITGLTDLKNNKRSRIWTKLKYNSNFVLSNSHHHLRTIKRKKNIIKEKIKNGSLISGKRIPSQLDIDGRKKVEYLNNYRKSESLQHQLLLKQLNEKSMKHTLNPTMNDQQVANLTSEQIASLKFTQQKDLFIQSHPKRKVPSKRSRVKLMTCLKLLKLANAQIKQKIESLQSKVTAKTPTSNNNSELITTIRKVYTLLAKHVGIYLPEKSRLTIRKSLLDIPEKVLENKDEQETQKNHLKEPPEDTSNSEDASTIVKNSKIILLANETLDMLSKVIEILDEKLNKAENWVTQNQEEVYVDALEYQPE